jgi:hypothetical protein
MILCFIALLLSVAGLHAELKKDLPKYIPASNYGKEFYLTFNPVWMTPDANNYIKILAGSLVATNITVSIPGKNFSLTKPAQPNELVEFKLDPTIALCYTKTDADPPQPDAIYHSFAIIVTADDPIIVSGVVSCAASNEAFLAMPVSGLGTNYIVNTYNDPSDNKEQWLPGYVSIIAPFPNTDVRFIASYSSNGISSLNAQHTRDTVTKSLQKGDVWLISSNGSGADLTGSVISANHPIAVIAGNFCSYVPEKTSPCGYMIEMLNPNMTYGLWYPVPQVVTKSHSPIIKIIPKFEDTKIFREGRLIASLTRPGDSLGSLHVRASENLPLPVMISGDKEISVMEYNTGRGDDNLGSTPFQMTLQPMEQFGKDFVFVIPSDNGEPEYSINYVNAIYMSDEAKVPDSLMLVKAVGTETYTTRFIDYDPYPGLEIYCPIHGKRMFSKTIEVSGSGVYYLTNQTPIACYTYGFSSNKSYGFPAGSLVKNIEKADNQPPNPTWTVSCDGSVTDGYIEDMPKDPKIRSNLAAIIYLSYLSSNYYFSYAGFIPGQNNSTTWQLLVKDVYQDAKAVITFTDQSGNDTTITIEYHPAKIAIYPDKFDFGFLKIGEEVEKEFLVVNTSDKYEASINHLELKTHDSHFEIVNMPLPMKLGPLDTLKFIVRFKATDEGYYKNDIVIGDTCLTAVRSTVEATIGMPVIDVNDVDFADVTIGRNSLKDVTIVNSGNKPLTINGYHGPTNSCFIPHFDRQISNDNPLIIQPSLTYSFTIEYIPDKEIELTDSIVICSDATRKDSVAVIHARGIKPGLAANSYDWGRRRIDRVNEPDFRVKPYPPDDPNKVIKLENNGIEPVIIYDVDVVSDLRGSAFEYDKSKLINKKIMPNDSLIVPCLFHPVETGEHELVIRYNNSQNSLTETKLTGVGVVPKIMIDDYYFGTTVINVDSLSNKKSVRITNMFWQYADTLNITGFQSLPNDNTISFDPGSFGTEGFRIDMSAINLPVKLLPSETLMIPVEFSARHADTANASLKILSDALGQYSSNWQGYGVDNTLGKLRMRTTTSNICVGSTDTIYCFIENIGLSEVSLLSIAFDPVLPEFSFAEPDSIRNTIILQPGDTKTVKIIFQPNSQGNVSTSLVVKNTSGINPNAYTSLICESKKYDAQAAISPKQPEVEIGKELLLSIYLDNKNDISSIKVDDLAFDVIYDNHFLALSEDGGIQPGNLIEGKFQISGTTTTTLPDGRTRLSFQMKTIGNDYLNNSGELAKLKFSTFLPDNSQGKAQLEYYITPAGTKCFEITTDAAEISLKPYCVKDLRSVMISQYNYDLISIDPNPSGNTDHLTADISLAFDSQTELTLLNSMGQEVGTPLCKILPAGPHSIPITISDLPSGIYWCRMKSGPYEGVKSFVVVK